MMRPEFGLPRRYIDTDRAIRLASLAREAERQSMLDGVAVPAVIDYLSPCHFMKQVSTA